MSSEHKPSCEKCGNNETIEQKRNFLGFGECRCTICNSKFENQYEPLSRGYRIGYWIIVAWMGVVLANMSSSNAKQWGTMTFVFAIVFLFGAGRALLKDMSIRKRLK